VKLTDRVQSVVSTTAPAIRITVVISIQVNQDTWRFVRGPILHVVVQHYIVTICAIHKVLPSVQERSMNYVTNENIDIGLGIPRVVDDLFDIVMQCLWTAKKPGKVIET
jgi:hypothetical protein